jgi:hypothetical protein
MRRDACVSTLSFGHYTPRASRGAGAASEIERYVTHEDGWSTSTALWFALQLMAVSLGVWKKTAWLCA